jgi:hypothetical protein
MKIKLGTQLEEEVFRDLKVAASREKRAMGEMIQEAVVNYLERQTHLGGRKSGLTRLLASPELKITDRQFHESMEADFFEQ